MKQLKWEMEALVFEEGFFFFFWGRKNSPTWNVLTWHQFCLRSIAVHTRGSLWRQRVTTKRARWSWLWRAANTWSAHTHGNASVSRHVQRKKPRNGPHRGKIRPDLGGKKKKPSSLRGNSVSGYRKSTGEGETRGLPWPRDSAAADTGSAADTGPYSSRRSHTDGRCLFSAA